MTEIAFFQLENWEKENLKAKAWFEGLPIVVVESEKILTPELFSTPSDFEIISVFVDSAVTKELLDKFPKLRFIATRSTGFDHIDLETCKSRGIQVANVPAYGETTVAEYAFALILSLTRKVCDAFDRIRETGSFRLDGLRGQDLEGKTLGVVGVGRIGQKVIRIAKGFNLKVLAYDPYPQPEKATELGFDYVSLETLLGESDIITLHSPQTTDNLHLINEEKFRLMKKRPYLINTARGGLVDTVALIRALKEGLITGAGIDVLEEEGITKDELSFLTDKGHPKEADLKAVLANHVLIDLPNVIITPHNAFNTTEALERIMATTTQNIRNFLEGKPSNLVN